MRPKLIGHCVTPSSRYSLVRWRHKAWVSPPPPREPWPLPAPNLFAGIDGAPEIDAEGLSVETLGAGLQHRGCLIVRHLIPRVEAAWLAPRVRRVFEAALGDFAPDSLEDRLPWFAPFEPRDLEKRTLRAAVQRARAAVWTADSPRLTYDLIDAFERAQVLRVIEGYFGERPVLSVEKATLRRVPPTTGTDWHQDGAFLGGGIRAINVWLTLSECGADAPGLDLLPRRLHDIVPTGTHGALFDWSVGHGQVALTAEGTPIVTPVCQPGDAILFDQLFLHRTAVRPGMTKERLAIESWFFAPSTKPHDHTPIVL